MNINIYLLDLIHDERKINPFLIDIAQFISDQAIWITSIILLLLALILRNDYQKVFIRVVIGLSIVSIVNYLFDKTIDFPRPFELGLTNNYINHSPNNSFPSSHMFIASTMAFTYLLFNKIKVGVVLLMIALAVGWSRIYLGVHFPVDIVGSLIFSFSLCCFVRLIFNKKNTIKHIKI